MILKENSLNITELELFKAVERWIVANVDMKSKIIIIVFRKL